MASNTSERVARQLERTAPAPKPHRSTTKAAYDRDLHRFTQTYGFSLPCTADDMISFIRLQMKRVAPATAYRRCMAIQSAHVQRGMESPTNDPRVREAMRSLAARRQPANLLDSKPRSAKSAPKANPARQAKPITSSMLDRIFDAMGTGRRSIDLRDKALMLLGFAGMKRAQILALDIQDCRFTEDALMIRVEDASGGSVGASSEEGRGRTLALPRTRGPMCPVGAVEAWLDNLDRRHVLGPLFCRFDRGCDPVPEVRLDAAWLAQIIKRRMKDAGYGDVSRYSAESLRRGGAQEKVR